MPKIQVLPKQVAELIAAGEVVERPASVIKELVENSIDAKARHITVEIQHGGITFIRITDDGCGIAPGDVPLAFLRHATSKIQTQDDLTAIATLGFRGEALAAVSSVARVELFTKTEEDEFGTHYRIEGGEEILNEEAGCPNGTTLVIRDLFYNTPARMKFLKKDATESSAAAAVVDRIALSHPEIAFTMLRDGKQTLQTAGNGDLRGTVYSVLGRDFAGSLIPVERTLDRIGVSGLTCKPVACKPTRNHQFVFLNGRLVRSGTVMAAAEQAYKNSAMIGKFPGFVLYLNIPFDTVDVNVHPAKTEVRFSDERRIFDAVYGAVKDALAQSDTRPEINLQTPKTRSFGRMTTEEYRQQAIQKPTVAEKIYFPKTEGGDGDILRFRSSTAEPLFPTAPTAKRQSPLPGQAASSPREIKPTTPLQEKKTAPTTDTSAAVETAPFNPFSVSPSESVPSRPEISVDIEKEEEERPAVLVIGEAFGTYIITQMGDSLFLIDKHAAHERILFNQMKEQQTVEVQALLSPVVVTLPREEYSAIVANTEKLLAAGFETEDFGGSEVLVRAVPAALTGEDVSSLLGELAGNLLKSATTELDRLEDMLHTVACRAAIKAGNRTGREEMQQLAEKVLYSDEIRYCPHGRPVAFEIKKRQLEKQFGRIQ